MSSTGQIIVTGAGGRIGRLLRRLWPEGPIWLTRQDWDILDDPIPDLPAGAVWLDLSGRIAGDLSINPLLAGRVAEAAQLHGARLIYVSSASVYAGGAADQAEHDRPDPAGPYGASKLAAEAVLRDQPATTILRLGNVAGADALLGVERENWTLDPVPGQPGGPIRSYIGPHALAEALWRICMWSGVPFPPLVNLALTGGVAMADLLDAAGRPWQFGPARPAVLGRVVLSVARLSALIPLPPADAVKIVADLNRLGEWPK